ncbi:MAG: MoaD/ThiS family protein, partial [Acidimicrobiia bacterium]
FVTDDDVRYLNGLDTPVPSGQTVSIVPAVAGGQVDSIASCQRVTLV